MELIITDEAKEYIKKRVPTFKKAVLDLKMEIAHSRSMHQVVGSM